MRAYSELGLVMRWPGLLLVAGLLCVPAGASAEDTVLVYETRFSGGVNDRVEDRMRRALVSGLRSRGGYEVLSESDSRDRLGDEASRLYGCDTARCRSEAASLAGADFIAIAAIEESGEIYAFQLELYSGEGGERVSIGEGDCPLCTIDEAVEACEMTAARAISGLIDDGTEADVAVALSIETEPDDAVIWVAGERVGTGRAHVEVAVGRHEVRVERSGYEQQEQTIIAEAGEDMTLRVALVAVTPSTDSLRPRSRINKAWGSVLVGAGIVALGTGGFLLAIDGESTCSGAELEACPDVFDTAIGGGILAATGAAGLTSGIFLLVWSGDGDAAVDGRAGLGLGVGRAGARVTYSGSF